MRGYLGKHCMVDLIQFRCQPEDGDRVHELMKRVITDYTNMTIVGESKKIFAPEEESGFTSILLLNSSHMSCHCYSNKCGGLLSIDIYTCNPEGGNCPVQAMMYFLEMLKQICPTYHIAKCHDIKRFPYERLSDVGIWEGNEDSSEDD